MYEYIVQISKKKEGEHYSQMGFPAGSVVKNSPANAADTGDVGWIAGWERSPEGENGNPLQYFCLGNPLGRRAWRATVHEVARNRTRLSN